MASILPASNLFYLFSRFIILTSIVIKSGTPLIISTYRFPLGGSILYFVGPFFIVFLQVAFGWVVNCNGAFIQDDFIIFYLHQF